MGEKKPIGRELKVSIITISLNSAPHIEDSIRTVAGQSYEHIEHIVIDGGSTDGTKEIIKRHAGKIAHWVSEPDNGISDAFNKGVRAASGDIVTFLNSQDYYVHRNVVRRIVEAFTDNPGARIVYGKTFYVPIDSTDIVGVMGRPFTREEMARRNILPHQSVFVRKDVFQEFGPFKSGYRYAMDYEHLLRATREQPPVFIDEGLAVMRLGGVSDTQKFSVSRELYRAQRENGRGLLPSLVTLLYHYYVCTGLRFLRVFHVFTLGHLFKRLGLKELGHLPRYEE